jgi:hypothetical protein
MGLNSPVLGCTSITTTKKNCFIFLYFSNYTRKNKMSQELTGHQHYQNEKDKEVLSSSDLIHNLSKLYGETDISKIDQLWHTKPISLFDYNHIMGAVTRGMIMTENYHKGCPILGDKCEHKI